MYHRQIYKQFLTNRVLKDPKQKRFFKSNDLMELFSLSEGNKGTESEAIFAGTGSSIDVNKLKKTPREKSSGKFRDVPNLVKQAPYKPKGENEESQEKNLYQGEESVAQDDYVLKKLFRKSGVEAALKHDKIVDSTDPDHMIVESEAERAAKEAISVLMQSREQCWTADSGVANWTGSQGSVKKDKPKLQFGSKKPKPVATCTSATSSNKGKSHEEESNMFFKGTSSEKKSTSEPESAGILLTYIKSRSRLSQDGIGCNSGAVNKEHMDLLCDIRQFIAFQAMVDGQATTNELVTHFGSKLPNKDTPLFKKMLGELCSYRKVEGQGVWRLKPEFR